MSVSDIRYNLSDDKLQTQIFIYIEYIQQKKNVLKNPQEQQLQMSLKIKPCKKMNTVKRRMNEENWDQLQDISEG